MKKMNNLAALMIATKVNQNFTIEQDSTSYDSIMPTMPNSYTPMFLSPSSMTSSLCRYSDVCNNQTFESSHYYVMLDSFIVGVSFIGLVNQQFIDP